MRVLRSFALPFGVALTLLFGLSACNTMEGLGQDVESTGEALEREAQ